MAEIIIKGEIKNVNEKLAKALVLLKKAEYVTKDEKAEEDKPKRTYKTKVMKADE